MAISVNDNLKLNAGKPLDAKYLNGTVPYTSVLQANTIVPIAERSIGLTVNINNQDYWYENGVTDLDLVSKGGGGSPNFCSITLHQDIVVGADVVFNHPNGSGTAVVDNIDTNLSLTRASNQGLFNIDLEPSYNGGFSPDGTLWNWGSWADLSDITTRTYVNWQTALLGQIGQHIVGAELIMWDTVNNKYYKVNFTQWVGSNPLPSHSYLPFPYTPADLTVVTIGTRTYELNGGLWDNQDAPMVYQYNTLADAINNDSFGETFMYQLGAPNDNLYRLGSVANGIATNSIVTSISPSQPNYNFPQPTMFGGSNAGSGGFTYTRNLVTIVCDGSIHFPDGSVLSTANISVTPTNGLSLISGGIGIGGTLIQPTAIDALGSNTFAVNDQSGLFMKTRDAQGNFFFNNIGGNPTILSSSFIFSYLADAGCVFTNTVIVVNFGGQNKITGGTDFWNFGDYTTSTGSFIIRNDGRSNTYTSCSNATVSGNNNNLNACNGVSVIGNFNTISGQSNKVYIGNSNKNLVVDGVSGNVGIGTATPATSALLDLTSTTGALLVPRMTTTEKNALTAVNGMILYDTILNKFQGFESGAWVNL